MDIIKTIKTNINKFLKQTKKIPVPIKIIVYGYFSILGLFFLGYLIILIIALYYDFAKISDLHTFAGDITSASLIGAVCFISRFFIDNGDGNGGASDGIPDFLQDKSDIVSKIIESKIKK